ncbi:MAG: cytochrome c [Bacteroidota bacterium]
MKKSIVFLFLTVLIFVSCKENKKELTDVKEELQKTDSVQVSEAYTLLKTKCYACHNPNAESHDNIIAPPMAAVKKRYLRIYDEKESFVEAITNWSIDPKEEKAIMRGAVSQYNVMPYQNFKEEDMRKIASYIFENELEVPDWFEAHEEEMHGQGGRRRMGRKNN